MFTRNNLIILLIVTIFGGFIRIYQIDKYPPSLNHDEVTQLYDAISIAETGKDIYGNNYPFIFRSINDFKPPFYTYSTALFFKLFGWQEFTIKMTAILFGILMIPAVYIFSSLLLRNTSIGIIAAFITVVSPFEIFYSRKGFENGAGIFLMILGFIFLLYFFEKKKNAIFLNLSAIFFGLAMYTYFSHVFIIPLFLTGFYILYKKRFEEVGKRIFLKLLVVVLIVTLPLIYLTLINPDAGNRSQAVFISQDLDLGRLTDNLFNPFLKVIILFAYSFNRFFSQFDLSYLFANGLDLTNQGFFGMGPLLFIQLPFLVIGIIYIIRNPKITLFGGLIILWIILGMLPSGLTFEPHSPHRSVMVFTMLNIISAVGMYYSYYLAKKLKLSAKLIIFTLIISGFTVNFIYFIHIYTINYSYEKSQFIQYPFKQIAQYAWTEYPNFEKIVIDPQFGQSEPVIGAGMHYYLGLYGKYDPSKMQKEFKSGEGIRETKFDKFFIRKVDFVKDKDLRNTLIIASPWSLPEDIKKRSEIIKTFTYYDGTTAFYAIKL